MLVYSAVCRKPFPVIYKLDRNDGSCDVVTMDWLVNPQFLSSAGNPRRIRQQDRHENSVDKSECQVSTYDSPPQKEDDYDDRGFAPIRRQLPPLRRTGSGTIRGQRSKRSSSDGNGAALLSSLRTFVDKEASHPGSGVRLFVQSCVLSGCDYVPNRLSKVGPVTAFRLVKEASHRDPGERFERVLKSLPMGSRILAEVESDKNSEDGIDDVEVNDKSSSPSYSDSDVKKKYEELLSKSEALFYYHLVKELAGGTIASLVPHPSKESGNPAMHGRFYPSIDRFNSDLSFVGSTTDAMKSVAELETPRGQSYSGMSTPHGKASWMSAVRRSGPISNSNQRPSSHHRYQIAEVETKDTTLQKFMNGNIVRKKEVQELSNKASTDIVNSDFGAIEKRTSNTRKSSCVLVPGKIESTLSKTSSASKSDVPTKANKHNPFAVFAHEALATESIEQIYQLLRPQCSTAQDAREVTKLTMSPSLSPSKSSDMFDYEETVLGNGSASKSKLFDGLKSSEVDIQPVGATIIGHEAHNASRSSDNSTLELLEKNENKKACVKQGQAISAENNGTPTKGNEFDYEIIPETPPIQSSVRRPAISSKYFYKSKNRHDSFQRTSTSPLSQNISSRSNAMLGGSSPEDAIEVKDEYEAEMPNENNRNCNQLISVAPKKSSVNKRPFISPYPNSDKNQGGTSQRKKMCPSASSAILAGFARQKKMESSDAGSSLKKSTIFKFAVGNQKGPHLVSKRPKGTQSLRDFLLSSDKR